MLSGQAAGLSTRIVGIDPQTVANPPVMVQMAAFEGGVQPAKGDHYIVNGFPYSGMGFGYNPNSGGLSQLALTPNAPPSSWGGSVRASSRAALTATTRPPTPGSAAGACHFVV